MSNRRLEEIKLIALCMASDNRDAFSRLVEIHQQGLRRFVLNLTSGDEALTDDIAQETFIKAWLAIRSFHGLSGLKTWLYRIAINEYSSYLRRMHRMEFSRDETALLRIEDSTPLADEEDASRDVNRLLARLPEKERLVCLLFYLEEQPIKEIVRITGMPSGTIKSHLSRARSHLASMINKQ